MPSEPDTVSASTSTITAERPTSPASLAPRLPASAAPSFERFAPPAIALTITTPHGPAHGVWRPSSQRHAAVLLLAGADNDPGGPAGLYDDLAPRLQRAASVAQLNYPVTAPGASATNRAVVLDIVLNALDAFGRQGIERVVLMGWDMGGAVAAAAGARCPLVTGVACLAPDPEASMSIAEDIAAISPRRLLIAHGSADATIPQSASILLTSHAGDPTELALYPNETHDFSVYRDAVVERLARWATGVLRSPFRPMRRAALGAGASASRPEENARSASGAR